MNAAISSHTYVTKSQIGVGIGYLCLMLLVVRTLLSGVGEYDTLGVTVMLNALLLFAAYFCMKINKRYWFILCMLPIAAYNREILAAIDITLFVYIFKGTSIKKIATCSAVCLAIGLTYIYLLGEFGFIDLHKALFYTHRVNVSHAFGFSNANTFGQYIYALIGCLYVAFINKKSIWLLLLGIVPISFILYNYTGTRALFVCLLIVVIIHIFISLHQLPKKARYLVGILPLVLFAVNAYLTLGHASSELLSETSGRLLIYSNILYSMSPINWLIGVRIPEGPMDGSFWMLLFGGGLLWALFYYYNFYKSAVHYYTKWKPYLPIIAGVSAYGIAENIFWSCNGISIIYWLLVFTYYTEGGAKAIRYKKL